MPRNQTPAPDTPIPSDSRPDSREDTHPSAPAARDRESFAASVRPILRALARVIATDRRASALLNSRGEVLLANAPSRRIGITQEAILSRLDWPDLCRRAKRAESVSAGWRSGNTDYEGEVLHIPLGPAEGYMLRLAQSDQEATLLRNRARSAMLLRVAHDLRTPIQSLLASADALLAEDQKAVPADALPRMRRAAKLALDHISNVLAVIRGEQNSRGSQPDEDFRIAEEVSRLVELVGPIARAHATEISLAVDAPEGLTLHGPLRFVRALCQNLIDNSVNHGGGKVELRLSAAPVAETPDSDIPSENLWCVELDLRDQGGGLPPEQKARLFETLGLSSDEIGPQGPAADKRPSAGLNVLAHALKQLGGSIAIRDRGSDGEPIPADAQEKRVIGTVFTVRFSLPRAPDLLPAREETTAAPPAEGSLSGHRILLVEDSPSSRDWLFHLLRSFGATVTAVGSGPEALAFLSRSEEAEGIDLLLTDITLPRMSGVELAARLTRGDSASAQDWHGKIVGLTAHSDARIRAAALAAGMVCVLEKPVRPAALNAALSEILSNGSLSGGGQKPQSDGKAVIETQVIQDLAERLGRDPARGFLGRALGEARGVLEELRQDGIGPDTGRRLHAATGAAGLTGLALVERSLRAVELRVKEGAEDLTPELDTLTGAIADTRRAIDAVLS